MLACPPNQPLLLGTSKIFRHFVWRSRKGVAIIGLNISVKTSTSSEFLRTLYVYMFFSRALWTHKGKWHNPSTGTYRNGAWILLCVLSPQSCITFCRHKDGEERGQNVRVTPPLWQSSLSQETGLILSLCVYGRCWYWLQKYMNVCLLSSAPWLSR